MGESYQANDGNSKCCITVQGNTWGVMWTIDWQDKEVNEAVKQSLMDSKHQAKIEIVFFDWPQMPEMRLSEEPNICTQ